MGKEYALTDGLDWTPALSAIAQCGAALVAIIAGFFLSRLIQLSADQAQVRRRLADIERQADELTNQLSDARTRLILYHTGRFMSTVFARLAASKDPDLDVADLAEGYRRSNPLVDYEIGDELNQIVTRLRQILPAAFHELHSKIADGALPPTLQEYRHQVTTVRDLFEDRVYAFVYQIVRGYGNLFGYGFVDIQDYLLAESPRHWAIRSDEEHSEVAKLWYSLNNQRVQLDEQFRQASAELIESSRPFGSIFAVFILIYLSIGTVVIPLLYLAHRPPVDLDAAATAGTVFVTVPLFQAGLGHPVAVVRWRISHGQLVYGLFFTALLLLVLYMVVLLRRLRLPGQERLSHGEVFPRPLTSYPSHYPETQGRERNSMISYLNEKGIAVQIGPEPGGERYVATFSYQGTDYSFLGRDDLDAITKAYLEIYRQ